MCGVHCVFMYVYTCLCVGRSVFRTHFGAIVLIVQLRLSHPHNYIVTLTCAGWEGETLFEALVCTIVTCFQGKSGLVCMEGELSNAAPTASSRCTTLTLTHTPVHA